MKQHKARRYIFLAAVGFIAMCVGIRVATLLPEEGILKTLPQLLVGVGAAVFGGNLGVVFRNRALLKNPQAAKQAEIERKDERNQTINNKAKARVYDLMLYIYAAILFALSLVQAGTYVILTLAAVYLFFIFAYVYYLKKYHKEM